jgi:hypothetical protein
VGGTHRHSRSCRTARLAADFLEARQVASFIDMTGVNPLDFKV